MTREEFDNKRNEITNKYQDGGQMIHKLVLAYEYIEYLEAMTKAEQLKPKPLKDKVYL
jgi:hypothetical protein